MADTESKVWDIHDGDIPYIPDWNRWEGIQEVIEEKVKSIIKEKLLIQKDEEGNISISTDGGETFETVWTAEDLRGEDGADGTNGTDGKQGASWRVSINALSDNQIDIKTTDLNPPSTLIPYQVGDTVLDSTTKLLYSITEIDPLTGSASIGTSFGELY